MRFLSLILLFTANIAAAQMPIRLENPSFEGEPQDATVPTGWHPCERGSTPDILPGPWGVYEEAAEGDSFIGLITREDGTWESIGQRLSAPMQSMECYEFSVQLAFSETYAGYNMPLRLRIWGGGTKCKKEVLLAETAFIDHSDWRKYDFEFYPKTNCNYIIIEAYYSAGIFFFYKGNILIDDCSVINKCQRAYLAPTEVPKQKYGIF